MPNKAPKRFTKPYCLRVDMQLRDLIKEAKGLGVDVPNGIRPLIEAFLIDEIAKAKVA